jgi:hypothetical protein
VELHRVIEVARPQLWTPGRHRKSRLCAPPPPLGLPGRVHIDPSSYVPATYPTDPGLWFWGIGGQWTIASGTNVSVWTDQSGNTYNGGGTLTSHSLLWNTHTPYPQSNGATINGLPSLALSSASTYGTGLYTTVAGTGYPSYATFAAFTAFFCVKPITGSPAYARLLNNYYGTGFFIGLDTTAADWKVFVCDSTSPFGTCQTPATFGTFCVLTVVFDPTTPGSGTGTATIRINGTQMVTGTFTVPTATGQSEIALGYDGGGGSGAQINADVAEMLLYTTTKTVAQMQAIEGYLGKKYSIAV